MPLVLPPWLRPPWSDRRLILLLAALTLTKGLFWIALFPVFKIADEPSHFANVQYRGEFMRAPKEDPKAPPLDPVLGPGEAPEMHLVWQVTNHLFRLNYRPDVDSAPEEEKLRAMATYPPNRRSTGQMTSMNYPGLYYDMAVGPYLLFRHSSVIVRIEAVRLLSLGFGILAVVMTFLAGRLLMTSRALAFAAAVVVMLQPMESQMCAAVNNDAGIIGFSALVIYLQLRFMIQLPRVPSWKWGALLGLAAGFDLLCKPHVYALLPGCAVVCALVVGFNLRDRRAWLFALVTAAVFAALIVPNLVESFHAGRPFIPGHPDHPSRVGYPNFFAFLHSISPGYEFYLFRSTFGQFGWLEYSLRGEMMDPVIAVGEVAACGLVVAFGARIVLGPRRWVSTRGLLLTLWTALATVGFILYAEHRFRTLGMVGVIQGRNFLFGFPAVALLVAVGYGALVPARFRALSAAALASSAFFFHFLAIIYIAGYHYAP